jgi:hypothetical protein
MGPRHRHFKVVPSVILMLFLAENLGCSEESCVQGKKDLN